MYQKNAFECPCFYFTLQSRLDLDLDLLLAQSVQFSKIAKNSNIDFCQLFSHWKEALSLSRSWNKKWGHRARFCSRAAESAHQLYFLQFLREDWDEFQNGIYAKGGRKHWNICFPRIYIEISQLRYSVIEMVLKWNLKWFNTTLISTTRVSVRKMNSATRVPLTLRTFPTHWVSSWPETTTIEKPNNISPADFSPPNFVSWMMFLQTLFSRGPYCYAQWGMRSVIPANHLKRGQF